MTIQPLGNRILCVIREGAKPEIIMLNSKKGVEPYGLVIAIGEGVKSISDGKPTISVGDKILFNPAHGMSISHKGEPAFVLDANLVLAKYIEEPVLND